MTSIRSSRRPWLASVLLATLAVAACSKDTILQPDLPDVIDGDAVNNAQGAPAIYAGAVSELVVAMDGGLGVSVYGGLFTDELMHSSTPPAVREWDLRGVTTSNSIATSSASPGPYGPFLALNRARTALEISADRVKPLFPANDKRIGEMWALAGMSYILIGEHFCSGAPFSKRSPTLEYGASSTTSETLNLALDRLTTAAANSGGDAAINNLIAVLKGRALLDLGQFGQAATAVAAVPTNYVYQFVHSASTARQQNNLFLQNDNDVVSLSDQEGTNGLNFATAGDPRVPAVKSGRTSTGNSRNDTVTPQYYLTKYTSSGDPVTYASGLEARLIEAEAALQAPTNVTLWLQKLNEVRAQFAGLTPLTDPGDQNARVDLMFRERAFTLFLTSHRLGDLRRLVRQYGRAVESVYPTGAYHKQGLTRGVEATFPVPNTEENNPSYQPSSCTFNSAQ